jgi:hypothetical protein
MSASDEAAPPIDPATVVAIALLAYPIATLVHEGLGHGLACALVGGRVEGVSLARCSCDVADPSPWDLRAIKAAGTGMNLLTGLPAALAATRIADPHLRWFVSLFAAISLLAGAGYPMTDPIGGFGDWTGFLEGLPGWLGWVISAAGLAGYIAAIRVLLLLLEPWLGVGPQARIDRARSLCLGPYLLAGGVAMTVAVAFDRGGSHLMWTSALAHLGGTSALAWAWLLADKRPGSTPALGLARHPGWIAGGILGYVAIAAAFARGCGS